MTAQEAAKVIVRGYSLFHGRAGCSECHAGKLFTDNDFHNIGIGDSKAQVQPGKEPGRFAAVPYGLKDRRLIGAYKTPTLRNLELTKPYMHDGSFQELADVMAYYDTGLAVESNEYLDPRLLKPRTGFEPNQAIRLGLGPADQRALEMFLRCLRGDKLPAVLKDGPEK
jgi:cytochrome c peroxidase